MAYEDYSALEVRVMINELGYNTHKLKDPELTFYDNMQAKQNAGEKLTGEERDLLIKLYDGIILNDE